jgi:polyhydroxybutyrate depolymerase
VGSPGYTTPCKDPKPVEVQLIHGTADECALYKGGKRCGGCWERALEKLLPIAIPARSFPCDSVDDQAAFWRKVNGCSGVERETFKKGKARCVEYAQCSSKKSVSVCTIVDGGHTWPGGELGCDPKRRGCRAFADVTGPISRDLDANATMAKFFATWQLPAAR